MESSDVSPFEHIPCGVLLKILDHVEDYDYITVSTLSKKIRNCLVTGRYTASERREVETLLDKKKQALRRKLKEILLDPKSKINDAAEIFQLEVVKKKAIHDSIYQKPI